MLWFLWAQVAALAVYTVLRGYGPGHTALHVGGIVACAVLGMAGNATN